MTETGEPIRCVIFDMDGTIVDVPYDWTRIKRELGTGGRPILSYLDGLDEPERTRKWRILEEFESRATKRAMLRDGFPRLLNKLRRRGVSSALVTNNSRKNVDALLARFNLAFDLVMSRESGLWKPSPEPFFEVMRRFALPREACCVVGDSRFDWQAARDAGIEAVYLISREPFPFDTAPAEVVPDCFELDRRLQSRLMGSRA